jgi:hypothetical protein
MTAAGISWYLCILFIVTLLALSTVTVAPAGAAAIYSLLGACAGLAVFFAAVAVSFRLFRLPQPRWLIRVFECVAVLATIIVLLSVFA